MTKKTKKKRSTRSNKQNKPTTVTIEPSYKTTKKIQGAVWKVKIPNQKIKIFKADPTINPEIYIKYCIDKYIKKQKVHINTYKKKGKITDKKKIIKIKTRITKKTKQQIRKTLQQSKKINLILRKGTYKTTIKNALTSTPLTLKKHLNKLFKEPCPDQRLRKILIQDQNLEKPEIKQHLIYKITLYNSKGQTLNTFQTLNKTPNEVLQQLKKVAKKGTDTKDYDWQKILKLYFSGFSETKSGIISKAELTIHYKKQYNK